LHEVSHIEMEVNALQGKALSKTFANGYSIGIDDCDSWCAITICQHGPQNG